MKNLYVLTSLLFSAAILYAQTAPNIQWEKTFGGGGIDQAKSIVACTDGGYVLAGHSTSANGDVVGAQPGYNFWVVKLNSDGSMEWQKPLGGSSQDWGTCIRQTAEGGYIVGGYTASNDGDVTGNHGDFDYWVVKLDEDGNLDWQKTYGGLGIDQAKHIEPCSDGGYIIAGTSFSLDGNVSGNHGSNDFWLVKIDSVGALEWQKSLGGAGSEMANCVKQTDDGGFIIAGYSNSTNGNVTLNIGGFDFWIVKTDQFGSVVWQKSYGGTEDDQAFSLDITADGGYVVAGITNSTNGDVTSNHGAGDYWVIKLDNAGSLIWQKSFGGSSTDQAYAVQQISDGGYVVAGYVASNNADVEGNHGNSDYWILKLDTAGNREWAKCYGGSGVDQAFAIQQTSDNSVIITGYSTSSNGDVSQNDVNGDYWVVKLEPFIVGVNDYNKVHVSVYPNPTHESVTLQTDAFIKNIYVYDALGQLVHRSDKTTFSVSNLAAGIYTLVVETEKGTNAVHIIKR